MKYSKGLVELLGERGLCEGLRVRLVQRTYRHGGIEFSRDVVLFGRSVAVVPLDGDEVILLRQFRAPVNGWVLEVPAGRVEEGEDPEEAAKRELGEEAGYSPGSLELLATVYTSPGYSDELMHIYLATGLSPVEASREPGELIEVVRLGVGEALELATRGHPVDAKTLLALLLLEKRLLRRERRG